jgi:hypothetical protein
VNDTPVFFLSGHDLEMITIRDLLAAEGVRFHDHSLAWGAKASAYLPEIQAALAAGHRPVLVELGNDLPPDLAAQVDWIDHHGPRARADQPTSLNQVFARLGLPPARWTRHYDLVAANDRGHIRAMLALHPPATRDELLTIRAADRAAQGCTPEDEAAARAAIAARESRAGGQLTVLRLATLRTSPAADLMEPALGGPGYANLLILTPGGVNFFGSGSHVQSLTQAFPGGWYGGALPERGFWGHAAVDAVAVIKWLEQHLLPGASAEPVNKSL